MIFRFLTLITFFLLLSFKFSYADNHDTENNIIEKAKEINQKVKEKQALQGSASNQEEPLPLNDPFVGDGSLGGGSGIKIVSNSEEDKKKLIITGSYLLFPYARSIISNVTMEGGFKPLVIQPIEFENMFQK